MLVLVLSEAVLVLVLEGYSIGGVGLSSVETGEIVVEQSRSRFAKGRRAREILLNKTMHRSTWSVWRSVLSRRFELGDRFLFWDEWSCFENRLADAVWSIHWNGT